MSKTRILESVRRLDLAASRELLKRQPSLLGVTDHRGRNLLHLACSASSEALGVPESASVRMVGALLDCGIDVESTLVIDDYPCNSVWFAIARGRNRSVVRLLLKRGATPRGLFAAGWYDDIAMIKLLLRSGATVDEYAEDETPFLHCWKNRRFRAAKLLVREGADVNFQDSTGKTALHYGVTKAFEPALLRHLVSNGASPDIEDGAGVTARLMAERKRDKRFREALA